VRKIVFSIFLPPVFSPQETISTVKRLLLIAGAICAASVAWADSALPIEQPNPAVARIVVPEGEGSAAGSGSLVAVNEHFGLVVTNWHVVRDARGPIWVIFPSGFQSTATLVKADQDWDLAALLIFKPNVMPLAVSTQAPQIGERLTIAGHGSGWYQSSTGQCIKYYSPNESRFPKEWMEISTPARQGDSGGPIFNERGEIAGVLWGSDSNITMGSYCGRLRQFLAPLGRDFERLPPPAFALASHQNPPTTPLHSEETTTALTPVRHTTHPAQYNSSLLQARRPASSGSPTVSESRPVVAIPGEKIAEKPSTLVQNTACAVQNAGSGSSRSPAAAIPPSDSDSLFASLRNFLAVLGIFALFIQALKILGKTAK
jgi:hypothetical protein